MINEFDKEMDSLLRQAARVGGEAVLQDPDAHVDADEISLFAENALPVKARLRVTGHLADCNHCRKILSGVISLNAETESEIIHPKVVQTIAPSIPWYKKLFVFPQIVFAMGALAIVLSGAIAFIVLQNARESQNNSVAKIEEIQEIPKGASSDEEPVVNESSTASNSTAADTATTFATPSGLALSSNMSVNSSTAISAPVSPASPVALSTLRDEKQAMREKDVESELKAVAPQAKPAALSKREDTVVTTAAPPPKKDSNYTIDGDESRAAAKQMNLPSQNSVVQNQQNIEPDSRSVRQLPLNSRAMNRQSLETTGTADAAANEKRKSSEERAAGGKVFKRADNAWYDSAYTGQQLITVRRASKEYKKLDAGLRSIAENISGTIVVVWKGKAYRIQ